MVGFQTERLVIRDPKFEDFDEYHRLISDELTLYFWLSSTSSLEQNHHEFEDNISEASSANRKKYYLTIEHRKTKKYLGTVGYTVVQTTPAGKIVGAGYAVLPEYRGQGYATEAFQALIRFAFEEDGVYRFVAGCRVENRASERVMQKCGMVKEAEFKCHTWHDGQMKDRVEYRMLKDEYQRRNEGTNHPLHGSV